jgi:Co/Zn/Cd efflux system component
MMSVVFLITITIWLFFEATNRLLVESEVKGKEMLITAIFGLIFNLI